MYYFTIFNKIINIIHTKNGDIMENRIDLEQYNLRTDLIMELVEEKDYIKKETIDNINITTVNVNQETSKTIGKKEGIYITISFDDITDFETREKIGKCFEKEIKKILKILKIKEEAECLIIGLGNIKSTPDALGPLTIQNVVVTKHLFTLNTNIKSGIRKVSAISPGVMATTGIETYDIIKSVINEVKPDFIITIDSLAALSIDRVNKTIQMTDTGIHPGSGIGNYRKEISKETLNIPVIAIGVPTVVESATIVNDTINYLFKHISYIKNNYEISKLTATKISNYKEKIENSNLTEKEKKELIGMFGTLNDNDKHNLILEVLNAINYNLMVTPKEIDFIIEKLSDVIASSINNALHRQITHF